MMRRLGLLVLILLLVSCGKYDQTESVKISGEVRAGNQLYGTQVSLEAGSWETLLEPTDEHFQIEAQLDLSQASTVTMRVMKKGYESRDVSAAIVEGVCRFEPVVLEELKRTVPRESKGKPRVLEPKRTTPSHTGSEPSGGEEGESPLEILKKRAGSRQS
jgi:hypothetical protein